MQGPDHTGLEQRVLAFPECVKEVMDLNHILTHCSEHHVITVSHSGQSDSSRSRLGICDGKNGRLAVGFCVQCLELRLHVDGKEDPPQLLRARGYFQVSSCMRRRWRGWKTFQRRSHPSSEGGLSSVRHK